MNLLQLIDTANELEKQIIQNQGELTEALETMLSENETALAEKTDAYKFILDRLEKSEEHLSERAAELKAAATRLSNAQERIKEFIKAAMIKNNIHELVGNDFRMVVSKTKGRLIVDMSKLPTQFQIIKTTYDTDKERLRDLLESGEVIPGAEIQESYSLRTYINTKGK